MRWQKRLGVLVAGLILMGLQVAAPLVNAQSSTQQASPTDGINLTTSPLPIALNIKPGSSVSTDLRVKNSGTKTEKLQVKLLKFSANNDQGQPRLADREPGDDYFDWVHFSQTTFTAEPNVWNTISMRIDVPKTAGLGYYFAVVFARASENLNSPQGAGVSGGSAVLVLVDAQSPDAKRHLSVAAFTSKHKVYEFLPADFTVSLKNDGNIFVPPSGSIFIKHNPNDLDSLATLDMNPGHGNILPDSTRQFAVSWADGWPVYQPKIANGAVVTDKKGTIKYNLSWDTKDGTHLRFGKYSATVIAIYDDGQHDIPIEATVYFWVIPWRILAVLGVIGLLLLFAIFVIIRKMWRTGRRVAKRKPKASKHEAS